MVSASVSGNDVNLMSECNSDSIPVRERQMASAIEFDLYLFNFNALNLDAEYTLLELKCP